MPRVSENDMRPKQCSIRLRDAMDDVLRYTAERPSASVAERILSLQSRERGAAGAPISGEAASDDPEQTPLEDVAFRESSETGCGQSPRRRSKAYFGCRLPDDEWPVAVHEVGMVRGLAPALTVGPMAGQRRWRWGDDSAPSAELARALLADAVDWKYGGLRPVYIEFLRDVVSRLDDCWVLTEAQIRQWLRNYWDEREAGKAADAGAPGLGDFCGPLHAT